jgi:hypothetical protein
MRQIADKRSVTRSTKKGGHMADETKKIVPIQDGSVNNNHIDLSRLRLSQNFEQKIGVKKLLRTVPVRKPDRQSYFRVHPGADFRIETGVIELKQERETYLVDPELWPEIPGEVTPKVLLTAMTRQGVLFVLPVKLPGSDGKRDQWNLSLHEAAEIAMTKWMLMAAKNGAILAGEKEPAYRLRAGLQRA